MKQKQQLTFTQFHFAVRGVCVACSEVETISLRRFPRLDSQRRRCVCGTALQVMKSEEKITDEKRKNNKLIFIEQLRDGFHSKQLI